MKKMMLASLALCALATAASAEPLKMNEQQMGGVTAGLLVLPGFIVSVSTFEIDQTNAAAQVGEAAAVHLLNGGSAVAAVAQSIDQSNVSGGNGS